MAPSLRKKNNTGNSIRDISNQLSYVNADPPQKGDMGTRKQVTKVKVNDSKDDFEFVVDENEVGRKQGPRKTVKARKRQRENVSDIITKRCKQTIATGILKETNVSVNIKNSYQPSKVIKGSTDNDITTNHGVLREFRPKSDTQKKVYSDMEKTDTKAIQNSKIEFAKPLDFGNLSPIRRAPKKSANTTRVKSIEHLEASVKLSPCSSSTPFKAKKPASKPGVGYASVPSLNDCFGFTDRDGSPQRDVGNNKTFLTKEQKEILVNGPWRCSAYDIFCVIRKSQSLSKSSNTTLPQTSSVSTNESGNKLVNDTKNQDSQRVKSSSSLNPSMTESVENKEKTIKKTKKVNFVQKKITDMLPEKPKTRDANRDVAFKDFFQKSHNESSFLDDEVPTPSHSKPARRSYERRFKPDAPEDEPPTEQVYKELDKKKVTKAKSKKSAKDEKEAAEWAKHMNSMFEEIDKFELQMD